MSLNKPAGSASKGEETRRRILDGALELFHEKGYDAATMRDIAQRASVATGAAYYYFPSKDAIVLAFYERAAAEVAPRLDEILEQTTDLRKRLSAIIEAKLNYFASSRRLLSALAAHADPAHPLSPFSPETAAVREADIALFARAVSTSRLKVPDDLAGVLPRLLWMYQMGIILYWIHDRSPGQEKTAFLLEKTVHLTVRLLQFSALPLMKPLRRQVTEILEAATS